MIKQSNKYYASIRMYVLYYVVAVVLVFPIMLSFKKVASTANISGEYIIFMQNRIVPHIRMSESDFDAFIHSYFILITVVIPLIFIVVKYFCNRSHSKWLIKNGVPLRGRFLDVKETYSGRVCYHIATIDFDGVVITTMRHSKNIADYTDIVAYVNKLNPSDYTILVGGRWIE